MKLVSRYKNSAKYTYSLQITTLQRYKAPKTWLRNHKLLITIRINYHKKNSECAFKYVAMIEEDLNVFGVITKFLQFEVSLFKFYKLNYLFNKLADEPNQQIVA